MAKRKAAKKPTGGKPTANAAKKPTPTKKKKAAGSTANTPKKKKVAKKRVIDPKTRNGKPTSPKRKRPGKTKRAAAAKRKAAAEAKKADSPNDAKKSPGSKPGGAGEVRSTLSDPNASLSRSDMQMVASTVRRIPVRKDVLEASLARAGRIALSSEKERNVLAATRLLITAEQVNQADEHKGLPDKLEVQVEPMTVEGQRKAILAAITAETNKRAITLEADE